MAHKCETVTRHNDHIQLMSVLKYHSGGDTMKLKWYNNNMVVVINAKSDPGDHYRKCILVDVKRCKILYRLASTYCSISTLFVWLPLFKFLNPVSYCFVTVKKRSLKKTPWNNKRLITIYIHNGNHIYMT